MGIRVGVVRLDCNPCSSVIRSVGCIPKVLYAGKSSPVFYT
jgi:hypothetical protein